MTWHAIPKSVRKNKSAPWYHHKDLSTKFGPISNTDKFLNSLCAHYFPLQISTGEIKPRKYTQDLVQ